jgi:hypothetical protein
VSKDISQGLDYHEVSEEDESSDNYLSPGEQDEESSKIEKLVKLSQDTLDNKLVELESKKQSIEETMMLKHTSILLQAEEQLIKKLYAPKECEQVIEEPIMKDNGKGKMIDTGMTKPVVIRDSTKVKELKVMEEAMKGKLRAVNAAFTNVLKLNDPEMVQVLYDIAEHELNKTVHYKNEKQAIIEEIELVERAIEEKDLLVVQRRQQRRKEKLSRRIDAKKTGESSSSKKRKIARAESVFSVGALEKSSSRKSRKSK